MASNISDTGINEQFRIAGQDNASQGFLTGEKIGASSNWKKDPVKIKNFDGLREGDNVLAITAWDSDSIAAINGTFKMADGTSFGTSDVDQWKVFQADVDLEDCNNSKCLGYDTSEKFVES